MRLPKVILFGAPISGAFALLTLASGEEPWVAGVALGTGFLVVFTIAVLAEGTHPVVSATVDWRGTERRALLVRLSRSKLAYAAFITISALCFFAFIAVMASRDAVVGGVAIALVVAASIPLVALVIGPSGIAILREGLLVRMGLTGHFIPWSAITDVRVAQDYGDYAFPFLRVTVRDTNLIDSNGWGRLWRRLRFHQAVSVPTMLLRVSADEAVGHVTAAWRDSQSIDLSTRSGTPQPWMAPLEQILATVATVADSEAVAIFRSPDGRQRYVQIGLDVNGQLLAGAASNAVLDLAPKLTDAHIDRLMELGWAPLADGAELFEMRLSVESMPDMRRAATVILQALRDVYGLATRDTPFAEVQYAEDIADPAPEAAE